ncbi:hypothetical protein FRC00_001232 [Tulasnella sp. 408]|nr:hypothetical protein FRC00_001232 [Tulasnella sp. 408]
MVGLATIGGGLVIGLSAGVLAPVIGAGLGAAFGTVGISGTTAFLTSTAGAAMITTGGAITGSSIAGRGMVKRTQQVRTFELLPLHNNKRVNCIVTVTGFMSGPQDDARLPFSVLDPTVGDVFSVLWEPEMMQETGNALKILTAEVLSQVTTTVLQATVMTALMSAIQWPLILTKLGYLIDNPWSNALDRAFAAGKVLADVLINRHLGVRPITLIGFSLGARVIFYALLELAKQKAYGIVQDVFLLGACVTAPKKTWYEARGAVSGRFVNGYARNDWILNYLFRATSGGLNTVAGLRPVEDVPGLENVDVTDKIAGHMSYRIYMPVILDQLGFPVSATYFDEPEDLDELMEREFVKAEEAAKPKEKSRFSWFKRNSTSSLPKAKPPPSGRGSTSSTPRTSKDQDDDLPERMERHSIGSPKPPSPKPGATTPRAITPAVPKDENDVAESPAVPSKAGFDFQAIGKALGKEDLDPTKIKMPVPTRPTVPPVVTAPLERSESAPISATEADQTPRGSPRLVRASLNDKDVPDLPSDAAPRFTRAVTTSEGVSEPVSGHLMSASLSSKPSSNAWSSSGWSPADDLPPLTTGGGGFGRSASFSYPLSAPAREPALSFGGIDGSISSYGAPAPGPTLSFGMADGSISSTSLADPWSAGPKDDKKKSSWNPNNPWS